MLHGVEPNTAWLLGKIQNNGLLLPMGEKWALRNAKLRFSRKRILLTGMLACFSWKLHGWKSSSTEIEGKIEKAITYFESYFARPPLEILADELLQAEAPADLSASIFSAYDKKILRMTQVKLSDFDNVMSILPTGGAFSSDDVLFSARDLLAKLSEEQKCQWKDYLLDRVKQLAKEYPDLRSEFREPFASAE